MNEFTISARILEELSKQITALERALRHNRSWVIEEAILGYVESERQFLEAVAEGIRVDEADDVAPHEAVMAEIDDLLARYPKSER